MSAHKAAVLVGIAIESSVKALVFWTNAQKEMLQVKFDFR